MVNYALLLESLNSTSVFWFNGKIKKDNTNAVNYSDNLAKASDILVYNSIKSSNLKTYHEKSTVFKVSVTSGNKPLTSGKVVFIIKNRKYVVDISDKGVVVLKLKLKPGTYYVTSTYGKVSVKNNTD